MQRHPMRFIHHCRLVPRRCHALLWWTALRSPPGRRRRADCEQSGDRQNSRRVRVPSRTRDVRLRPPLSAPDLLTSTTRIVLQGQELLTSNMMVRQRRGVEGENSSAGLASSHPVLVISVGLPDGDPETGCSVVESSFELVGR